MERLFIGIQILCTNARDEAKDDLDAIIKKLPRTYTKLISVTKAIIKKLPRTYTKLISVTKAISSAVRAVKWQIARRRAQKMPER
jgi:hypothetical protein